MTRCLGHKKALFTTDNRYTLVNARVDGEALLTREGLLPTIGQILLAGHETTTNLVCNGIVNLLRIPDLVAQLCAQPELIEPMVEEVLPQMFSHP